MTNLTVSLASSLHYYCKKLTGTSENLDVDISVLRVK